MKVFLYLVVFISTVTIACRDSNSPAVSAIIDSAARRDDVVTDTKGPDTIPHMDTTQLIIDSAVNIKINGTPLKQSRNAAYLALYDNWLHAYTLVHHLPATLNITYVGTVMMGTRGDIMEEVAKARNDMKNYIARDIFHKAYGSLSSAQQAEIQRQHSILFQKEFR